MSERLCYVTAYLDLGRENWTEFQRSFDLYFQNFIPLVDLILDSGEDTHELVVFIDSIHHDKVKKYVQDRVDSRSGVSGSRSGVSPLTIVPIDDNFMINNIPAWSRLARETEIMNSTGYRTLLCNRLRYPEHNNPKYTLINHAKIDFVNLAFLLSNCEYFCWVDFGYCNPEAIPERLIDINLLDKEKININLLNPLTEKDNDVLYTILNAPERVGGGFFFGNRKSLETYQKLYHEVHIWFQEQGLADDDQHLITQCYFHNKDLFKLEHLGGWFKALKRYQKPACVKPTCTKFLESMRLQKLNVLEIGAVHLEFWRTYFPHSNVYGTRPIVGTRPGAIPDQTIFPMDQIDPESIQVQILDREIVYDIIIDNGLKFFPLNWSVLKQIFIRLSPEGIYIIPEVKDFDPEIYKDPFLEQIEYKVGNAFVARKKGLQI